MGWGGDGNVPRTCTHVRCLKHRMFLALAHMVDATPYDAFCWVGWVGVGMVTFLVLAHMFDASNTGCFLHLHTWSMLRHMMFFVGWDGLGWGW